ncbi:MAG: hypothetical protein Q9195_008948 [Heterodermia aff. obscurata]
MPLPLPPVALKDHCSIIYKNTLYTYQKDAFQSLPLEDGAQWSKLSLGVSTNGSTCVQGTANGQDVLYVVGGSTGSSAKDYTGLQRYTFKDKSWETCQPQTNVTQNRLLHGSTFLEESSSILLYGGSQDGEITPSSQTFIISSKPPYTVQSFNSQAPPVIKPLMLPWNTSHALMFGGDPQNKALFTFGPEVGWHQLNVSLSAGLPDSSKVQAAIIDAQDGGRALEIFDMSISPNKLTTQLLQNATGPTSTPHSSSSLITPSPTVTTSASSSSGPVLPKVTIVSPKRSKRATSLQGRPAYDSALAPQDVRDGFSLAQGSNGLVVASGGNDQAVLAIFNQTGNQWVDADQFFSLSKPKNLNSVPTTSSTSPAASITAQPSTSSSPAAAPPTHDGTKNKSLTILGATLGAVFGVAALLVLILLLLRCLRRKREDKRRGNEFSLDNKHDMDFADQGADYMQEAGGSFAKGSSKHHHNISGNSATSVTIMGGKRNSSQQSKRALFHKKGNSETSNKSHFGRSKSPLAPSPPMISEPILDSYPGQSANPPRTTPSPRTEPRTDTGWSTYFNNSSTNIDAMAVPAPQRHGSNSRPATYTSTSDYESSRVTSSNPHESAEVEPLNVRASQLPPNTRVVSPTSGLPLQTGLALSSGAHAPAEPPTPTTLVSDIDEEDYRMHASREPDGTSSWTPIAASDRGSTWTDRPESSAYADSMIYPHPGERVRIPNFPGVPSRRPSNRQNTRPPVRQDSQSSSRGMRSAAAKDFASGPAPSQAPDPPNTRRVMPGYGAHEVRTFPRRSDDLGPRGRGGRDTEGMSWLKLGTSK